MLAVIVYLQHRVRSEYTLHAHGAPAQEHEKATRAQAVRAAKADAELAAREERARLERHEAKKRKLAGGELGEECGGEKGSTKKKGKARAVLSFAGEEDESEA